MLRQRIMEPHYDQVFRDTPDKLLEDGDDDPTSDDDQVSGLLVSVMVAAWPQLHGPRSYCRGGTISVTSAPYFALAPRSSLVGDCHQWPPMQL
jgi:hypothetical protein